MNRLFIGLGTIACLGFSTLAVAANGSVAASMTKDFWIASKKNQERALAQAATRVAVTEMPALAPALVPATMPAAAPVIRPPADNPRPAR